MTLSDAKPGRAWRWAAWIAGAAWTVGWLRLAFLRWRFEQRLDWIYGPFAPLEEWEAIRRGTDWATPLCIALVPAVLWLIYRLVKAVQARRALD